MTTDRTPGAGLNELAAAVHRNAVDHGWWEEERSLPEILMLCVSELAEALEEYRSGAPMVYCGSKNPACEGLAASERVTYQKINGEEYFTPCVLCNEADKKPEGIAIELADCMICVLDYCGHAGIDIEQAIRIKHEYNKSRPYRHGGKKC